MREKINYMSMFVMHVFGVIMMAALIVLLGTIAVFSNWNATLPLYVELLIAAGVYSFVYGAGGLLISFIIESLTD